MGLKKDNTNYDGSGYTRSEIAWVLDVSVEYVGQVERRAIEKMRAHASPEIRELLHRCIGA